MTAQECLEDELEYLQELKQFFERSKYEIMAFWLQKRILKIESKIKNLVPQSETIY